MKLESETINIHFTSFFLKNAIFRYGRIPKIEKSFLNTNERCTMRLNTIKSNLFVAFAMFFIAVFSMNTQAQVLADVDFDTYNADSLNGQKGWQQYNVNAARPIMVSKSGADGYVTWAGGNTTDGQDVSLMFASRVDSPDSTASSTTKILYFDAEMSVATAGASPSYFLALNGLNTNTTTGNFQNCRIAAKSDGAGYVVGARVNGQSGYPFAYGTTNLTFNTKYAFRFIIFLTPGNANDSIQIFVGNDFNTLAYQATSKYTTGTVADPSYGALTLSQFGSATVTESGVKIEKLKVFYDNALPVELTSFTSSVNGSTVSLNWVTATELNNQGFEVERKAANGEFMTVGFVNGKGTTSEVSEYNFVDQVAEAGSYTYRLRQIDFDGSFEYSNEINVDVTTATSFALGQNYPNPFNPSTSISFSLAKESQVNLSVYNLLGEKVATLVNNVFAAGSHTVDFNAANLTSGMYLYKIEAGEFVSVKKMSLLK